MSSLKTTCIHCGSPNSVYSVDHGYRQCLVCEGVWGFDDEDPDYDECNDLDLQDALAEQVLGSGGGSRSFWKTILKN